MEQENEFSRCFRQRASSPCRLITTIYTYKRENLLPVAGDLHMSFTTPSSWSSWLTRLAFTGVKCYITLFFSSRFVPSDLLMRQRGKCWAKSYWISLSRIPPTPKLPSVSEMWLYGSERWGVITSRGSACVAMINKENQPLNESRLSHAEPSVMQSDDEPWFFMAAGPAGGRCQVFLGNGIKMGRLPAAMRV